MQRLGASAWQRVGQQLGVAKQPHSRWRMDIAANNANRQQCRRASGMTDRKNRLAS